MFAPLKRFHILLLNSPWAIEIGFLNNILSRRKTFVRASTLAVKSQRCFGKVAQVLNASCHQGEGRIPRRQPVPAAASSRQCLQGISKSAPHAASGHWKFLDTVVLLPGMSSGSRIQWESVYSQLLQLYSNVDRTRLWVVLFSSAGNSVFLARSPRFTVFFGFQSA